MGDAPTTAVDWTAAKGIQITGSVTDIEGDEERDAGQKVAARYPTSTTSSAAATSSASTPTEVHHVDNSTDGDEASRPRRRVEAPSVD